MDESRGGLAHTDHWADQSRTYKNVVNYTAKSGYRGDLRQAAVARASAIRKSQRPTKAEPEKKLRGNAAKRAAAQE